VATERVERRLTAILAADVARYSRLMGADEESTLAQLKAHRRALVEPNVIALPGGLFGQWFGAKRIVGLTLMAVGDTF
jgi:class 3 adenylate cyclase